MATRMMISRVLTAKLVFTRIKRKVLREMCTHMKRLSAVQKEQTIAVNAQKVRTVVVTLSIIVGRAGA